MPNLFVGTVHSFALSVIVMPFARAAGRQALMGAELASLELQDLAFNRAFAAVLGRDTNDPLARATMDRLRRLSDYSGDPLLGGETIVELSRRYELELQSLEAYDFNDIMRHAVEMLGEHEWLRRVLISAFPHLYVDEYQDLPPSLHALVELLCFDQAVDATLFAVGDPDQAIYGFMGTRPELLRGLANRSRVKAVELEINYRCANDIIKASLQALGELRKVGDSRTAETSSSKHRPTDLKRRGPAQWNSCGQPSMRASRSNRSWSSHRETTSATSSWKTSAMRECQCTRGPTVTTARHDSPWPSKCSPCMPPRSRPHSLVSVRCSMIGKRHCRTDFNIPSSRHWSSSYIALSQQRWPASSSRR